MAKYKIIHTPFYYLTLVSLAIMLLLGAMLFGSIILTAKLPQLFQEQIQVLAELSEGTSQEAIDGLVLFLKRHPNTQGETVVHVPKEEALAMMEESMGSDLLLGDMSNPFQDIVRFRMKGEELSPERLEDLKSEVLEQFSVEDVYFPQEVFGSTGELIRQLSNIFFVGFVGLLILVFILIHQIMKLNILANRFLIKTMEIVGATKRFIIRPFLKEAARLAFYSALIACGLFLGLLYYSLKKYGDIDFYVLFLYAGIICLFTLILAFGVTLVSTWMTVEKQLGGGYETGS